MIKKMVILLFLGIGIFLSSCNSCTPEPDPVVEMDYLYNYTIDTMNATSQAKLTEEIQLPYISVCMEVVNQLAPDIFVVDVRASAEEGVDVASITLVIDYDSSSIELLDTILIDEQMYLVDTVSDIDVGFSVYNNTGVDFRFIYASLEPIKITNTSIFRYIIKIKDATTLKFSDDPNEFIFSDINANLYPLERTSIEFIKK